VDDKDSPNIDKSKESKTKMSTNKSSLPKLADSSLEQYSMESVKNDIAILEKERDTLAKNANMGAIAEYKKKEADYLSR
jgi:structural maintenance of chromosome 4